MSSLFLTGGTGFVGMAITEAALSLGWKVILYARHPLPDTFLAEMKSLPGELVFSRGDVLDAQALTDAVCCAKPDFFVHGAAITPSEEMERSNPQMVFEINSMGVVHALEAARKASVSRFLYLGSISAYGKTAFQGRPLAEGESMADPVSLYELSKFAGERLVLRYKQLFHLDACVARIGDVYGPWERRTGVRSFMSFPYQTTYHAIYHIPAVFSRDFVVDWVNSADIAGSVLALLQADQLTHDVYPLCSGKQWSILDWCQLLKEKYPDFEYCVSDQPSRANIRVNQLQDNAPMSLEHLQSDTQYVPVYTEIRKAFSSYMDWLARHNDVMA